MEPLAGRFPPKKLYTYELQQKQQQQQRQEEQKALSQETCDLLPTSPLLPEASPMSSLSANLSPDMFINSPDPILTCSPLMGNCEDKEEDSVSEPPRPRNTPVPTPSRRGKQLSMLRRYKSTYDADIIFEQPAISEKKLAMSPDRQATSAATGGEHGPQEATLHSEEMGTKRTSDGLVVHSRTKQKASTTSSTGGDPSIDQKFTKTTISPKLEELDADSSLADGSPCRVTCSDVPGRPPRMKDTQGFASSSTQSDVQKSFTAQNECVSVADDDVGVKMEPDSASQIPLQLRPGKDSEQHLCQVCNDIAAGFHCGAYVCEACKKFFVRCLKQDIREKYVCSRGKSCAVTKETRTQCQFCRYQKCVSLGMYKPGSGPTGARFANEISHIPCKVCESPSSGYHFGAITCEGCKGFFRRTVKERSGVRYVCSRNGSCNITVNTRNICKYCRYQKCLSAGMTPDGSRIGRQPNAVKHATMMELQRIQNQVEDTFPPSKTDVKSELISPSMESKLYVEEDSSPDAFCPGDLSKDATSATNVVTKLSLCDKASHQTRKASTEAVQSHQERTLKTYKSSKTVPAEESRRVQDDSISPPATATTKSYPVKLQPQSVTSHVKYTTSPQCSEEQLVVTTQSIQPPSIEVRQASPLYQHLPDISVSVTPVTVKSGMVGHVCPTEMVQPGAESKIHGPYRVPHEQQFQCKQTNDLQELHFKEMQHLAKIEALNAEQQQLQLQEQRKAQELQVELYKLEEHRRILEQFSQQRQSLSNSHPSYHQPLVMPYHRKEISKAPSDFHPSFGKAEERGSPQEIQFMVPKSGEHPKQHIQSQPDSYKPTDSHHRAGETCHPLHTQLPHSEARGRSTVEGGAVPLESSKGAHSGSVGQVSYIPVPAPKVFNKQVTATSAAVGCSGLEEVSDGQVATQNQLSKPVVSPDESANSKGSSSQAIIAKLPPNVKDHAEKITAASVFLRPILKRNTSAIPIRRESSMHTLWNVQMAQFGQCATAVIKFARKMPGFQTLPVEEQIKKVQLSMYPIVLAVLSLQFNSKTQVYNYFHLSTEEREIIFERFPHFTVVSNHFRTVGNVVSLLNMDDVEIAFLCGLLLISSRAPDEDIDAEDVAHMEEELAEVLRQYCIGKEGQATGRDINIKTQVRMLNDCNQEHQRAVMRLRQDHPELEMPQLFLETYLST